MVSHEREDLDHIYYRFQTVRAAQEEVNGMMADLRTGKEHTISDGFIGSGASRRRFTLDRLSGHNEVAYGRRFRPETPIEQDSLGLEYTDMVVLVADTRTRDGRVFGNVYSAFMVASGVTDNPDDFGGSKTFRARSPILLFPERTVAEFVPILHEGQETGQFSLRLTRGMPQLASATAQ